jgi:hypothetical protein
MEQLLISVKAQNERAANIVPDVCRWLPNVTRQKSSMSQELFTRRRIVSFGGVYT